MSRFLGFATPGSKSTEHERVATMKAERLPHYNAGPGASGAISRRVEVAIRARYRGKGGGAAYRLRHRIRARLRAVHNGAQEELYAAMTIWVMH